jgi:serine/threonine-protein kinase
MRLAVEALPLSQKEQCSVGQLQTESADRVMNDAPQRARWQPVRVMLKDIGELLDLDPLLRPRRYRAQEFEVVSRLVAFEKRSGLYWQRQGSGFTLDWQQAKDYVESLNASGWQGRSSWRLPTIEELLTILSPPLHDAQCSTWPLFDATIHWLWSSDPCNKKQAWMVDVVESYFGRLDRDGIASVCAVSSLDWDTQDQT